jgi:hypothetical protein
MKAFAQMNKLKKMAMMVVGQNLSPDDLKGALCCVVLCCVCAGRVVWAAMMLRVACVV